MRGAPAHDPRVTLTEAEIERLCDALEDSDAEYRVEQRVAREVEHLIAARLAPIRALAEEWAFCDGDTPPVPHQALEDLKAALDASSAPVSASQDHDWHQPLTHCHCGRVIPCRHHDGAEGQGEGR